MIEDIFGNATWPIAIVVLALIAWFGWSDHTQQTNTHQLRTEIVRVCGPNEDRSAIVRCANDLTAAIRDTTDTKE